MGRTPPSGQFEALTCGDAGAPPDEARTPAARVPIPAGRVVVGVTAAGRRP